MLKHQGMTGVSKEDKGIRKPENLCLRMLQNHPISEVILSLDFKDILIPALKSWFPKRKVEHKIIVIEGAFIVFIAHLFRKSLHKAQSAYKVAL